MTIPTPAKRQILVWMLFAHKKFLSREENGHGWPRLEKVGGARAEKGEIIANIVGNSEEGCLQFVQFVQRKQRRESVIDGKMRKKEAAVAWDLASANLQISASISSTTDHHTGEEHHAYQFMFHNEELAACRGDLKRKSARFFLIRSAHKHHGESRQDHHAQPFHRRESR